jgi:hypothetical protein
MAECARELGNTDDARRGYTRYLADDPNGAMAETARHRLDEIGPAPPPEPPPVPPHPQLVSTGARLLHTDALPPPAPRQLWEDWPFWTVIGAVLVAAAAAIAIGVVLGTNDGGPACGPDCVAIDW